jgi:peptidoglycan/LPS O-acetylase OafA/YrhL
MPGAARYTGMFRTAAVLFVFFGAVWIWRFAFTDYHPEQRPWGLGLGALVLVTGVFLFRRARFAIGLSALGAGVVCLSATVFAPQAHGPGILFLAGLAIVTGLYAALALRVLFGSAS